MLALMAGRNSKQGTQLVEAGEVRRTPRTATAKLDEQAFSGQDGRGPRTACADLKSVQIHPKIFGLWASLASDALLKLPSRE